MATYKDTAPTISDYMTEEEAKGVIKVKETLPKPVKEEYPLSSYTIERILKHLEYQGTSFCPEADKEFISKNDRQIAVCENVTVNQVKTIKAERNAFLGEVVKGVDGFKEDVVLEPVEEPFVEEPIIEKP